MARYTGPKHRLARKYGTNILDKTSASLQRRLNIPPGIHGRKRKRRLSEYGQQLQEKQKAKIAYGLLEKQFKNLVKKAQKEKGDTGEKLVSLLETRLDNLVYRLGFAKTRFMSRQLVSHGHVFVNEKKINIPSYEVKIGSIISLKPKMEKNSQVSLLLQDKGLNFLPFVKREGTKGKLLRLPIKDDLVVPFNLQLIVEYYSR
jgi:small subunit ribosomal protein S4